MPISLASLYVKLSQGHEAFCFFLFCCCRRWTERAREHDCPWDENTCTSVAENSHLFRMEWAREQNPPCPWDGGTLPQAAHGWSFIPYGIFHTEWAIKIES